MTVIVADSNNGSYDGNLSTANGFYRCEAHNLACANPTTLGLTTSRRVAVTFANSGNCQGAAFYFQQTSGVPDKSVGVHLQETKGTCTITIASPGVVTNAGHGLANDTPVTIATTGALPTGLSTNTVYFVRNAAANTFELSATAGGASINTSGSQSGTHTLWATRAYQNQTPTQMFVSPLPTVGYTYDLIVPFLFTPYAVDTTASKWSFFVWEFTGSTGWTLETSDGTNANYFTWCDNQVSFANNDTLLAVSPAIVDQSATLGGVTATGYTSNGVCFVACRTSSTTTTSGISMLKWDTTPASSYTLTIKGVMIFSNRSGWEIGTSANPIPAAQQAIVNFASPTTGTKSGIDGFRFISTFSSSRSAYQFWGEIPTNLVTTLNGDASSSATSFTTTDNMSAYWTTGDKVFIGKANTLSGAIDNAQLTISSVSGTTVNLTTTIGLATRKSGAKVVKSSGYGIVFTGAANQTQQVSYPAYFHMSGVKIDYSVGGFSPTWQFGGASTIGSTFVTGDSLNTEWLVEDCFIYNYLSQYAFLPYVPEAGMKLNRVYQANGGLISNINAVSGVSGAYTQTSCISFNNRVGGAVLSTSTANAVINSNTFYNQSGVVLTLNGVGHSVNDNVFWAATTGHILLGSIFNSTFSGNYYDWGVYGISLASTYSVNNTFTNEKFGTITANTTDITFGTAGGYYFDNKLVSPTGSLSYLTTGLARMVAGTKLRITDFNDTTNDDRMLLPYGYLQRTGTSLSDTTVHTSGGFAQRFESSSSTSNLEWSQTIPTGDIQNKTMTVAVWAKINSANYYGGTYQLPRLTINYDNGTTTYTQATASTSWQLLVVTFTPATAYGSVTATLSTKTDQTGSNAYVYFDDWSILYPASVALDLGTIDNWSNAEPVNPTIAIPISAYTVSGAVWEELTTSHTTAGTFGKAVGFIYKVVGWLRGLL